MECGQDNNKEVWVTLWTLDKNLDQVLEEIILTDKSINVSVQLGFIFALGGFYHECVYNWPAGGWSVESCMECYCVRT